MAVYIAGAIGDGSGERSEAIDLASTEGRVTACAG